VVLSSSLQVSLIDVAPLPTSARVCLHNRMLCLIEVPRCMFPRRRIAAANVSALEAHAQLRPLRSFLKALFACSIRLRLYVVDVVLMNALSHFNTSYAFDSVRHQLDGIFALQPGANSHAI
jgi:hypothetical protein